VSTIPFNPDADVHRTFLGELVQWNYGEKIKMGTVRWINDEDATWTETGEPFSSDGKYFGRLVTIECVDDACKLCHGAEKPFMHVGEQGQKWWAHYCNECQLSPVSETVSVQGVLF
jgi:hypothetical protein